MVSNKLDEILRRVKYRRYLAFLWQSIKSVPHYKEHFISFNYYTLVVEVPLKTRAPWLFDRVGKKPSVKADLVIYNHKFGISR